MIKQGQLKALNTEPTWQDLWRSVFFGSIWGILHVFPRNVFVQVLQSRGKQRLEISCLISSISGHILHTFSYLKFSLLLRLILVPDRQSHNADGSRFMSQRYVFIDRWADTWTPPSTVFWTGVCFKKQSRTSLGSIKTLLTLYKNNVKKDIESDSWNVINIRFQVFIKVVLFVMFSTLNPTLLLSSTKGFFFCCPAKESCPISLGKWQEP